MRFKLKEKVKTTVTTYDKWFAWYPVQSNDGYVVWLEYVIRWKTPYETMHWGSLDYGYHTAYKYDYDIIEKK